MKFTANRKITLALGGHVLAFEKGDVKYVPPVLRSLAMAEGMDYEGGEDAAADQKALEAADAAEKARVAAVKLAMKSIAEKGDPKDFDSGGMPTAKAINAAIAAAGGNHKVGNKDELVALWGEVASAVGQ